MECTGGWTGRILRVDLSSGQITEQETLRYVPDYIGGRGIAVRIGWDEIPPGVGALDPDNVLMFFTGPLTGTTAPFSGRTTVSGLGPQGYPHEWFTRSNMGGHWGPELKYAGFDGVIVKGAADRPVYLWIHDGQAEIRDASHLWGLGIYAAQQQLMRELGRDVKIATIGQAGENLSRIAIISTETESSAGQGGFGAVMGAKRLKAIAVRGTSSIKVAHPDEFLRKTLAIQKEFHTPTPSRRGLGSLNADKVAKYGERFHACSQQCVADCACYYTNVPAPLSGGTLSGQYHCVAALFEGFRGTFYDWYVGFEAGFELSKLANDWGINHWDLLVGVAPWLNICKREGILTELDGQPINLDDPRFWHDFMRKLAYRQGLGDLFAEGGRRAIDALGVGLELADKLFLAWGYAGHWDGHGDHANRVVFPYWLVSALQWAVDVRDPIASGHCYAQNCMRWSPFLAKDKGLTWDEIASAGAKVYGHPLATDPLSGYEAKAWPAVYHGHRSILKDSATLDDWVFPRIFSTRTPDRVARADGMEGPSFEYHMIRAATGAYEDEAELDLACERAFNLERALAVRNHGRRRSDDERVIPYFESLENEPNPLLGKRQRMDRGRFLKLMDEYFTLRGWSVETGVPTREKLVALGLPEVANELEKAQAPTGA